MDRVSWTWLASWIIITALGWILGEVTSTFITGYLIGPGSSSDSIMLHVVLSWASMIVIGGITVGILVGAGQWFLLRAEFPNLKWVQTTIAGWIIGIIVCFIVGLAVYILILIGASALLQNSNADARSWDLLILGLVMVPLAFAMGWIALGATTGLFQWIELRRSIEQADRYFRDTIIGWIVGLPITIVVMSSLERLFIVRLPQTTDIEVSGRPAEMTLSWLFFTVAIGIYGLTVGAITGIAMLRLFAHRARSTENNFQQMANG